MLLVSFYPPENLWFSDVFPENKNIAPEKWNFCVWYTTLVLKKYRKENWLTSIHSFVSSIKGKVWSLVFLYLLFSYNLFYLVLREFQYSKTNETQNIFARLFDVYMLWRTPRRPCNMKYWKWYGKVLGLNVSFLLGFLVQARRRMAKPTN